MDNFDKIQKLKLALRGLDLHLIKVNKKNNLTMIDGHFTNSKYPQSKAKEDVYNSKKDKYLVTTINWTFTNLKSDSDYNPDMPSPNLDEVYKRQYILTIGEIFKFKNKISKMAVKEQIIKIEPFITDKFY